MGDPLPNAKVEELIRIADGSVKEKRGYWYTLGIPINSHYNLEEQIEAIRQLGLSRSQRVFEYLKKLNECESIDLNPPTHSQLVDSWQACSDDLFDSSRRVVHKNAKGEFGKALTYYHIDENYLQAGGMRCAVHYSRNHPKYKDVKKILHEALSQLEMSLGQTTS